MFTRILIACGVCATLVACGCDKDASNPDESARPALPKTEKSAAAAESRESADPLVGRWVRVDSPGKLFWHFAPNGEFYAAFTIAAKADKSQFPKPLDVADRWTGNWKVEGDVLILSRISAPSQPPHKDVRLPLKPSADKTMTEIDGVKYKKEKESA